MQGSALKPPWPEENTIQLCRTLDIVKEMNVNIYLESNFLDEFGVGDEYDGQRNSEAKGVDEDYVPGMCEYISICEYYSDMCENNSDVISDYGVPHVSLQGRFGPNNTAAEF